MTADHWKEFWQKRATEYMRNNKLRMMTQSIVLKNVWLRIYVIARIMTYSYNNKNLC